MRNAVRVLLASLCVACAGLVFVAGDAASRPRAVKPEDPERPRRPGDPPALRDTPAPVRRAPAAPVASVAATATPVKTAAPSPTPDPLDATPSPASAQTGSSNTGILFGILVLLGITIIGIGVARANRRGPDEGYPPTEELRITEFADDALRCAVCRRELAPGFRFCDGCGTPVSAH